MKVWVCSLHGLPVHRFLRLSRYGLYRRQALLHHLLELTLHVHGLRLQRGVDERVNRGFHLGPLGLEQGDRRLGLVVEEVVHGGCARGVGYWGRCSGSLTTLLCVGHCFGQGHRVDDLGWLRSWRWCGLFGLRRLYRVGLRLYRLSGFNRSYWFVRNFHRLSVFHRIGRGFYGFWRVVRLRGGFAECCVKIVFWFHSCHILRVCVVCQLLWRVFCFCAYIAEHRFDDPHRALCSTQGEGIVYRGKLAEQVGLLTAQVRR